MVGCAIAYDIVGGQCEQCMDCGLSVCPGHGNPAPAPETEAEPADEVVAHEVPTTGACAEECNFEGTTATCGERISYVLDQKMSLGGCEGAVELVQGQCPMCLMCTPDLMGCTRDHLFPMG